MNTRNQPRGFTLVEILVVMVLIAIIAAFATPAMNSILKGSKLSLAGDELIRELNLARQIALRDNAPVEFRFYSVSDPDQPQSPEKYRAYQAVRRISEEETVPLTEVTSLPDAVIFSESTTYSKLLGANVVESEVEAIDGEATDLHGARYKSFQFMTDGGTNLSNNLWFVTLVRETAGESELPDDFVTVQIDPFTGKIQRYEK